MTEMTSELEDQKALAATRLQEIEKLRAEKVDLSVRVDELKIQVSNPKFVISGMFPPASEISIRIERFPKVPLIKVQSPPDELITSSAKYKSLQTYLTVLDMEYKKLQGYYKVAKDAVTILRNSYLEQLKEAQVSGSLYTYQNCSNSFYSYLLLSTASRRGRKSNPTNFPQ